MAGFDYQGLTRDAEMRNYIKFTDEEPVIRGIVIKIGALEPNSYGQKVYSYYIQNKENGIISILSNGSGRLMKEYIRLNIGPGDYVEMVRTTVPNKPMETTYQVTMLEKGDGTVDEVIMPTATSTQPDVEDDDEEDDTPF